MEGVAADHHLKPAVGERQGLRVPQQNIGPASQLLTRCFRHSWGQVHSGVLSLRPAAGELVQQGPGAAAHVQHPVVGNLAELPEEQGVELSGVGPQAGVVVAAGLPVKAAAGALFL